MAEKEYNILTIQSTSGDPVNLSENDYYDYAAFCTNAAGQFKTIATPFTIAIFGRWGRGKSSIVQTMINKLSDYPVVEYNPWNYNLTNFESVWQSMIAVLGLTSKAKQVTSAAIEAILSFKNINYEKLKGTFYPQILQFEEAKRKLDQVISDLMGKYNKDRVFIFIDDLDRCEPKISIDVLRAIQVLCRAKNCVIVLAMDRDVITDNLKLIYNDSDYAREYLDKIIQLTLYVPEVFYESVEKVLVGNSKRQELQKYCKLIAEYLDYNPRKIERFIYLYDFSNEPSDTEALAELVEGKKYTSQDLSDFFKLYEIATLLMQLNWPKVHTCRLKYKTKFLVVLFSLAEATNKAHMEGIVAEHDYYPELKELIREQKLMKLLKDVNNRAKHDFPKELVQEVASDGFSEITSEILG